MYNKIAPIILNSGKTNGLSDVFVAQPDSLKETLAGKIFIIAEISGKKTDGRKILNFLISSLNDNYYNDEKILLRDKIEGLKIENIFEAAISKTNKNLNEFLNAEKIKLNIAATNLTVGVIFENKLYFSSFGKNRALLIYRHGEQYEVINVEANAADISSEKETGDKDHAAPRTPSFFSSVISGEIPAGSYFVFASEAMPEYINSRDLVNIISKLPPIVAAEQIKNILGKINSFIPFLGVIIKNTTGLDNQELREETEENLTAHSSISSLNYTEQKTERMLAPAGLINLSKIYKDTRSFLKKIRPQTVSTPKKVYRVEEEKKNISVQLDLGKVKSLNIARSDSFLIKEKIFFKRKPNWLNAGAKSLLLSIPNLFSFSFWPNLGNKFRSYLGSLNSKNRLLAIVLVSVVLIFLVSLGITNWSRKQQAARNNYNNLVTTIEEKQNTIDSYLLYNNEDGAKSLLVETNALLSYLPKTKKDQIAVFSRLESRLNAQSDKIQKVIKISQLEKVNDLNGLGVSSIVWANNKIYAAGGKMVFEITPQSASSSRFEAIGATNLSNPQFDRKNIIYYWDNNKIAQLNLKTQKISLTNVTGQFNADGLVSYKIFNNSLYVLAKSKNQIYRFSLDKTGYSLKTDWLKEAIDLSLASDFFVDGNVYVLKNNGEVFKFYKGLKAEYTATTISPLMSTANKIIVGTKYIYIFEASSKRLVVLAIKDGHLMNQYQLDNLVNPQDFAIDENNKTAFFLDNNSVYKLVINQ